MAFPHLIHDGPDGVSTERDLHGRIIVTMPHTPQLMVEPHFLVLKATLDEFIREGAVLDADDLRIGSPIAGRVYRGRTVIVFVPLASFDEAAVRDPDQRWQTIWERLWDEATGHTTRLRRFGLVRRTPGKVVSLPVEDATIEGEEVAV